MNQIKLSTSFINQSKHAKKSNRFEVVQPSQLAEVLSDFGFDLVHLKTSKSKIEENKDFQTTVARYRQRNSFEIKGLSLDIIIKAPHIYGSIETVLGLFRGVCSNQLNVGNQFENFKVRHTGDPLNQLNQILPRLVNQQSELADLVLNMSSKILKLEQKQKLAIDAAMLKLEGKQVVHVNTSHLLNPKRAGDVGDDLFSVYNVVQETIQRQGIRYIESTQDLETNKIKETWHKTRIMKDNTQATIEFNKQLFDVASSFLEKGI